jgi:hypothetical protein
VNPQQCDEQPAAQQLPINPARIALASSRAAGPGFRPFVKVIDRDETAPALERLAESRLALYPFGLEVNADLGLPQRRAPGGRVRP